MWNSFYPHRKSVIQRHQSMYGDVPANTGAGGHLWSNVCQWCDPLEGNPDRFGQWFSKMQTQPPRTHGSSLAPRQPALAWKSNNSSVGQPIGPGLPAYHQLFTDLIYAASLSPALGSAVSSTFTVAGEARSISAAGRGWFVDRIGYKL